MLITSYFHNGGPTGVTPRAPSHSDTSSLSGGTTSPSWSIDTTTDMAA